MTKFELLELLQQDIKDINGLVEYDNYEFARTFGRIYTKIIPVNMALNNYALIAA